MPTLVCRSKGKSPTSTSTSARSRSISSLSIPSLNFPTIATNATRKITVLGIIVFFVLVCDPTLFSNCFVEGITQGPSLSVFATTSGVSGKRIKMSTDNAKNSASAIGELKETIRSQKKEIDRLKAQLSSAGKIKKSAGGHGHGHGGAEELSEEEVARYVHDPFYVVGMQRVGWLGIFLGSLSATALIMNVFEETLEKHIELALFVPLLAGHGGNTGGQTVGTILSALSAGTVKATDAPKIVWKESAAGILSGSILGSIVAPIAYKVLGVSFHVAVVLFFTLPLVSMIASTLGAMIPFVCVFVGLDPSVIAAPAMTSLVDVAGLMGYFMIANYIFKLYGLEL